MEAESPYAEASGDTLRLLRKKAIRYDDHIGGQPPEA
jgi:hypothetical protein